MNHGAHRVLRGALVAVANGAADCDQASPMACHSQRADEADAPNTFPVRVSMPSQGEDWAGLACRASFVNGRPVGASDHPRLDRYDHA